MEQTTEQIEQEQKPTNKKKVIIDFNLAGRNYVTRLGIIKDELQQIPDTFHLLQLDCKFSFAYLRDILLNPTGFIYEKLTKGNKIMFGEANLALDQSKALELLEKPYFYNQFLRIVEGINVTITRLEISIDNILKDVFLNDDNTFEIDARVFEEAEERCKVYAETTECENVFEFANAFKKLLEEKNILNAIKSERLRSYDSTGGSLERFLSLIVKQKQTGLNSSSDTLIIDLDLVKKFNEKAWGR